MMSKARKLYKMGHLTKLLGVTPRTIRYYDQFGLLPHVKRSEGNVRLFDDEDIEILKKIKDFQQKDRLPLESIRDRLFGQKNIISKSDCMIVTDSMVFTVENQHKKIPLECISADRLYTKDRRQKNQGLPKLAPFSVDSFEQKYRYLHQQGVKRVYSVHSSSQFSNAYACAKSASNKVSDFLTVNVIETNSLGSASGLFINQLSDLLMENVSSEKIDLFISKNLPLTFSMFALDSISSFLPLSPLETNPFHCSLTQYIDSVKSLVIVDGKESNPYIEGVFLDHDLFTQALLDRLEEEYVLRGKHFNYIMITYGDKPTEATDIANKIKNLFPTTMLYIQQDEYFLPTLIGEDVISVSLV